MLDRAESASLEPDTAIPRVLKTPTPHVSTQENAFHISADMLNLRGGGC